MLEPKRSSVLIPAIVLFVVMLGVSAAGGAGFVYLHQELKASTAVANEALTKADVLTANLKTANERNAELKHRVDALPVEAATLREKNSDLEKKVAAKPQVNTWNADPAMPRIVINGAEVVPGAQGHTITLGPDGNLNLGGGIKFSVDTLIAPPEIAPPTPKSKAKREKDEAF